MAQLNKCAALTTNALGKFCGFVLPMQRPSHECDTALVRRSEDAAIAKASGFNTALGGRRRLSARCDAPNDLIVLPSRFGYLDDGDVLGFQAAYSPVPHAVQTSVDA